MAVYHFLGSGSVELHPSGQEIAESMIKSTLLRHVAEPVEQPAQRAVNMPCTYTAFYT